MTTTTDRRTDAANDKGRDGPLSAASHKAAEAYQGARDRTTAAYAAARERAGSAYESAGRRTSEGIDSNPVAAVVGGIALGAILGALLPRTQKEDELLGSTGRKITDGARDAARSAKEAGLQQLDELGLSKDGLRGRLDGLTDRAVGAVKASASSAVKAAGKSKA